MIWLVLAAALDAVVVSVHDGDTLRVLSQNRIETIRLITVDAPELPPRARCPAEKAGAIAATRALQALIPPGSAVKIHVNHGRPRDRYGRLLADVMTPKGDAGEFLLRHGLARPYRGGKRKGWCP